MQWDLIVECLVPTLKLIFYWGREPCTLCPSNPSLRGFTVHSLYIWALQFVYLTAKTTFLPKSLQWARNSKKSGELSDGFRLMFEIFNASVGPSDTV